MSTYSKTLYSRDSKGKILEWNISVVDIGTLAKVIVLYGEKDGKLAKKSYPVYEGKNFGKSNVTTYLEQAISEAKSKVNKKIKEGYREIEFSTIEELEKQLPMTRLDADNMQKPMLAQKFEIGKCSYPMYGQPKYNGVRAELGIRIVHDGLFGEKEVVYLKSREGNEYPVPSHIEKEYLHLAKQGLYCIEYPLDGEIYCHGMKLQDVVSAIKKPNEDTRKLYFMAYDIKSHDIQSKRLFKLHDIEKCLTSDAIRISDVATINNDNDANAYADHCIEEGYEGAILRTPNAMYQFGKRTKHLLKIKRHKDQEFLLIDIIESGNDLYNGQPIGMFICKNDVNNLTFKVTPEATKKERYDYLTYKNRYVGRMITVRFRERTKDNIPFHANGIIRDYE